MILILSKPDNNPTISQPILHLFLIYFLQFLAEHVDTLQSDASFEAAISKFDSNFSMLLLDLLDKLSIYSTNDCEHSMISIIYRYNCSQSMLTSFSSLFWFHVHEFHSSKALINLVQFTSFNLQTLRRSYITICILN